MRKRRRRRLRRRERKLKLPQKRKRKRKVLKNLKSIAVSRQNSQQEVTHENKI